MNAITVSAYALKSKKRKIRMWIGFWLLKDIPKTEITIRNGTFILDKDSAGIHVKNLNPFIRMSVSDCNFHSAEYEKNRKPVRKTLLQKIRERKGAK